MLPEKYEYYFFFVPLYLFLVYKAVSLEEFPVVQESLLVFKKIFSFPFFGFLKKGNNVFYNRHPESRFVLVLEILFRQFF